MKLSDVSSDILLCIADHLPRARDINYLARSFRHAYRCLDRYLLWRSREIIVLLAAAKNQSELLRKALQLPLDVNQRECVCQNTPLAIATRSRYLSIIKILLEVYGIDLHCKDTEHNYTPLQWAVKTNNLECMRLFLAHPYMTTETASEALFTGVEENNLEALQILMSHDVDLNVQLDGPTPLSTAILNRLQNDSTLHLLVEDERVDLNAPCRAFKSRFPEHDKLTSTFLLWITEYNSQEKLDYILQYQARVDFNAQCPNGDTALHIMAARGHLHGCQVILDECPHLVSMRGNKGETPLSIAIQKSHAEVYNLFMSQAEVDFTQRNENHQNLVHRSAYCGDLNLLKRVVAKTPKPLVDHPDMLGNTPLLEAVKNGYEDVVKFLIGVGADPQTLDSENRTPLMLAADRNHVAIAEILLDTPGVDIESRDGMGWSAYIWARFSSSGRNKEVESLLIARGADPRLRALALRLPRSMWIGIKWRRCGNGLNNLRRPLR